jgi:hypothetical protein
MRVVLGAFREMDVEFSSAWKRAIQTLPRGAADYSESLAELAEMRPIWQAAYERRDDDVLGRPITEPVLAFVGACLGSPEPYGEETPDIGAESLSDGESAAQTA